MGDDLYVTQKKFLTKGIDEKAGNSILVKLNQVGTVTETIENIKLAQNNNFETLDPPSGVMPNKEENTETAGAWPEEPIVKAQCASDQCGEKCFNELVVSRRMNFTKLRRCNRVDEYKD